MTSRQAHIKAEEEKFLLFLGRSYPYHPPRQELYKKPNPSKILVISDPHSPYENWKVLHHALENEHDAKTLIVPGDMGDYYSKSRFRKTRYVPFKDEARSVFSLMEWMASHWTDVRIMIGNHDNRPEKTIAALFDKNVDLLIMTETNLLSYFASFFPNVSIVGTQLDGTDFNLTHIYQYGDTIFTHGEISRVQLTATLEYISKYLRNWSKMLDLKPYHFIAQAHNHQDLKTSHGTEKWFSLPTAADPYGAGLEYIYGSRMYGTPPSLGYSVFYQDNGKTDYNRSQNKVFNYED
jgi:predicted phosphodiesterase